MARKHNGNIGQFFEPKSVCIVGASTASGKLGTLVLQNLLELGYSGEIFPVNPSISDAFGNNCYPNVGALPKIPELSVILIPAERVPLSIREHVRKGIKNVIIMSAGFKEIGSAGEELEQQIQLETRAHDLRIVGPNCLGVFDNISRLDTFFVPRELIQRPRRGNLSLASQSGSFVGHVMDLCESEHLGIARVITYGNKLDVNEIDALYYFARDQETKIVGLYLENVSDGRAFLKAAKFCAKRKPVIVLKGGRSASSMQAVSSHTGALGGNYASYQAAFKKSNLIEVESEIDFLDSCKALLYLPKAKGKRVLILGHAGGLGIALGDLCVAVGLEMTKADDKLYLVLKKGTVSFASVGNPIDLTASGTDDQAKFVLEEAFVKGNYYDICIYLALWGLPQSLDSIGEILSKAMTKSKKPIVVATLEGRKCLEKRDVFESKGLPVFPSLERAAKTARLLAS